jgi:hypothetical protein
VNVYYKYILIINVKLLSYTVIALVINCNALYVSTARSIDLEHVETPVKIALMGPML